NLSSKRKNSQNIFAPPFLVFRLSGGGFGLARESEEVDVFEIGVVLRETFAGARVTVDADFVEAADEMRRHDIEVGVNGGEFGVGADHFAPDFAAERVEGFGRRAFQQELAV